MIKTIDFHITELNNMKGYPQNLYYIGNTDLLNRRKISIVGSRRPNSYSKQYTHDIAVQLSKNGFCIVSGAAMGVDAISHRAAGTNNTIAVAGTGLDKRYPAVNKALIQDIEKNGLMLSQFKPNTPSTKYNFPIRNEIVVALGEALIVTHADEKSGTMRSVEFALEMGKPIYVLSHRIGESLGTQKLLQQNLAKPIYDIESFIEELTGGETAKEDMQNPIDEYFKTSPLYDEAVLEYPSELFEYELNGKIEILNGKVVYK